MLSRYVLRFDDIAPGMAWSRFSAFSDLAEELQVPLLLGVVPDCKDPALAVESPRDDFWEVVRHWSRRGWTIAQHGYTHCCTPGNRGLLAIGKKTELAGLPYESQLERLKAGKEILQANGVWQPVFMAPSHSFDYDTLRALAELRFRYLTDGYGVYPYRIGGLTAVPQLFSTPLHFGFGMYSICLHVNTMTKAQMSNIVSFVRAHRRQIISFADAAAMQCAVPGIALASRLLTSATLRTIRTMRRVR